MGLLDKAVDMKKVKNGKFILSDLMQGDESVSDRDDFNLLSDEDVTAALKLIMSNPHLSEKDKKNFITNSWRVHYRIKPPTIEEFITPEWIGPTGLSVYPHVQDVLLEFWKPSSPHRHLILAPSIGWGKSFCSTVSTLYITTHLWAMRNPRRFFNKSEATAIVQALISFSMDKAKQLLLTPFFDIIESSPRFKRVRTEDVLKERQEEFPNKVVWTSAGKIGAVQTTNNIHITIASNAAHLLGLNMISAVISEISFFLDRGISSEQIWRVYSDAKGRIRNRFGVRTFATTMIDSSPNDMEQSPIDKYIFSGEAAEDPLNYVVTGANWEFEVFYENYPKWIKTKKTFPVYRGSGAKSPKVLTKDEVKNYTKTEVFNVPIDLELMFKDNIIKSVKDYCGWPSGSQAKLINDFDIIEGMFSPQLFNLYGFIYAPASVPPERLIWEQIKEQFFVKINKSQYEFYRASNELRYVHVDQSESTDLTSITMVHPELSKMGDLIIVTDFNVVIMPGRDRINLDAITEFIIDLRQIGGIRFGKITFDQYQSAPAMQRLRRVIFPDVAEYKKFVDRLSVDADINIYRTLISWMQNGRVKAGRNIILKNNFKSLQEVVRNGKRKIDHIIGQLVNEIIGGWNSAQIGINANDASDSEAGAFWNCIQNFRGIPRYQWMSDEEYIIKNKNSALEVEILTNIEKNVGLIPV